MVKNIIETQPLTLAEVKNILSKRGKKAELSYIQRVTLEHTTKFSSLTARTTKSIVKKLVKQFKMEEPLAIQLVNISPTTLEELAAFVARAPESYTQEDLSKMLDILQAPSNKLKHKTKK